jgi:hypothetical protein
VINKIRGNKINVQIKNARGVSLRHVTYISRNGKLDWTQLNFLIGTQRNHLLCDENIVLPSNMGFRRFDNVDFKNRLAENMGLYILSQLDNENIKVGLYDVKGESTDVLKHLVKHCSCPVVVSDNLMAFEYEINSIYEEQGASVQLSNNRGHLADCDLIIAPLFIGEQLPVSDNTLILSGNPPAVSTAGLIYYNYYFRMPNQFDEIKPQELSEEYFCGALYTKARQFELGSIVPTACSNSNSTQTCKSLEEYLKKKVEEKENNKEKTTFDLTSGD